MVDGKLTRGSYGIHNGNISFIRKDLLIKEFIGNINEIAGVQLVVSELNSLRSYAVDLEDHIDDGETMIKDIIYSTERLRLRTALSWYFCLIAVVVCAIIVLVK